MPLVACGKPHGPTQDRAGSTDQRPSTPPEGCTGEVKPRRRVLHAFSLGPAAFVLMTAVVAYDQACEIRTTQVHDLTVVSAPTISPDPVCCQGCAPAHAGQHTAARRVRSAGDG